MVESADIIKKIRDLKDGDILSIFSKQNRLETIKIFIDYNISKIIKKSTDDDVVRLIELLIQYNEYTSQDQQDYIQPHIEPPIEPQVLRPEDLKIPPFQYEKSNIQHYLKISFCEIADGRVVIEYSGSKYFTTIQNVLKIPYPLPPASKYFNKDNGWSSSIEMAFKTYRKYLAEKDDLKYRPILNTDTKGSHGHDYEKVEGDI